MHVHAERQCVCLRHSREAEKGLNPTGAHSCLLGLRIPEQAQDECGSLAACWGCDGPEDYGSHLTRWAVSIKMTGGGEGRTSDNDAAAQGEH